MRRFFKSFGYAFSGISYAYKTQLNFKLHIIALLLVTAAGWYLEVTVQEWLWLTIAVGIVFITELINTGIEVLVDFVSPSHHEKAKIVKDVSASAVLFAAIIALIIGMIIFIPKIFYAA
ncbi:MAG: diacylglycerol kinase family protein [Pedobacter sp.]|nr:MAG: diacylglycerol kinase family protein [Pedobacter sp.]